MIPRYSRPEMAKIWTQENRFQTMLEVEILACEAMAELGEIPKDAPAAIRKKARFDMERIAEIEKETKHDVIAFLTNIGEYVGDEARYIHKGLTSSDVLDTALSVQMQQSADLLLNGIDAVLTALKKQAYAHKDTLCLGRSHGIHAEPTSFGLKMAGHYAAFKRARKRLLQAREEISVCTLSGAVGTFATIDPFIESYVAKHLNLTPEDMATQIIPRDRHAQFFAVMAVIASSIENLATEIRHLQRTEVREAEEFFNDGQKGSSAMPHKRNPVLSENLTGLARVIRAAVIPALENVTLWHERDISHSSVERVIGPDVCITLDFALHRLAGMMDELTIYPETMKKNLEQLRGLVFSQSVLLTLTQHGLSREQAYVIVQDNAMRVWRDESLDFKTLLANDERVTALLDPHQIDDIFSFEKFVRHTDLIFDRVFDTA